MKKRRIGIMLELMWPYRRHLDVFAGTQRFAQDAGNWVCEIDEFMGEEAGPAQPVLSSFDGLIARATSALARRALRAKVPLVNVWFNSPEMSRLPGVFPDFAEVGRLACEHLAERGFRRFGCLTVPRDRATQLMVGAFHDGVARLGCRCNTAFSQRLFYRSGKSWNTFQSMLDRWIATWTPPIALLVTFNDVTVRYVVHAVRRNGLRIPEDVALVTPTNEPMIGTMPAPALTSVEINYERIGYRAAEMLEQLMRGKSLTQPHTFIKPTGIIARDSTDYFAVRDEVVAFAMRHIERHANKRITVDDVAQAAGVSRRTLERRFQASSGRSVAVAIRRLRLLKAKRLLAETNLLIKQIARDTGFTDPVRFHEAFVREEGMAPSRYRERIACRAAH